MLILLVINRLMLCVNAIMLCVNAIVLCECKSCDKGFMNNHITIVHQEDDSKMIVQRSCKRGVVQE